jgi:hypothetical protein
MRVSFASHVLRGMFKDEMWESGFGQEKFGLLERIGLDGRLITNRSGLTTEERLPQNAIQSLLNL